MGTDNTRRGLRRCIQWRRKSPAGAERAKSWPARLPSTCPGLAAWQGHGKRCFCSGGNVFFSGFFIFPQAEAVLDAAPSGGGVGTEALVLLLVCFPALRRARPGNPILHPFLQHTRCGTRRGDGSPRAAAPIPSLCPLLVPTSHFSADARRRSRAHAITSPSPRALDQPQTPSFFRQLCFHW